MALIKSQDITPEEEQEHRQTTIGEAIVGNTPVIPGVTCVRGITPLVMLALQRANNPFVTNRKGFEAIGIIFDSKGNQNMDESSFALAIMPKVAEVLALLVCTRVELKQFAVNSASLQDSAFDIMENATKEELGQATIFISTLLEQSSKSQVIKSSEDEKPCVAVLEVRKKKTTRTG